MTELLWVLQLIREVPPFCFFYVSLALPCSTASEFRLSRISQIRSGEFLLHVGKNMLQCQKQFYNNLQPKLRPCSHGLFVAFSKLVFNNTYCYKISVHWETFPYYQSSTSVTSCHIFHNHCEPPENIPPLPPSSPVFIRPPWAKLKKSPHLTEHCARSSSAARTKSQSHREGGQLHPGYKSVAYQMANSYSS